LHLEQGSLRLVRLADIGASIARSRLTLPSVGRHPARPDGDSVAGRQNALNILKPRSAWDREAHRTHLKVHGFSDK